MRKILFAALVGLLVLGAVVVGVGPEAEAAGQPVLVVVASPTARTAAEDVVAQRLTTAGYDVTFADDGTVTAADAAGKAFVLVAQSTSAANATNVLRDVAVPVWVAKPYLFPTFGLTGSVENVDFGFKAAPATVSIAAPDHPMAAGRTGSVPFQNGKSLSWGKPTAAATTIARAGTDATIFLVEPGRQLATGKAAPACRLTFPLYTNGPTALTVDGLAMFDAAANWAASNCTAPAPPDRPQVLVVVANPATRTAAENVIVQRLTDDGFDVVVADDGAVTAQQASGKAFVLVAQSTSAAAAASALRNVAVPVWVAKPSMFPAFGLTGSVDGTDFGFKAATQLTIASPGHPMAAGRSGTVAFQTGHSVSWGKPPASATTIARAGTDAAIFVIEPGDRLANGAVSPACRLTFPLYTNGPTALTADGLAMFDAAARWAAEGCEADDPPPAGGVQHVIQVSVDGLNPDAITQLGPGGAPAFHRLIDQGASTLNARTVVERTRTLPNHTSVTTGRPVAGTSGHQVTFNDDNGSTLAATAGTYVAGTFDVVHDRGGSTAFYSGAPKLDFLDRSWNATNGAPDTTGADDGRDKIDTYLRGAGSVTTPALLQQLASAPRTFNFIHLASTDTAGHLYGFMSPQYLDAVEEVDGHIGQILSAVAGDPVLAASTVVIVSADHGGLGLSHEDTTALANYRIPFFVWGAGVAAGADLYALNTDRADPGTAQPAYAASPQPIRNADSANLVLDLLGLPAIPGSTINANQSLDVA